MKIFLSYHSADKKFVEVLADSLIRFGMEPIVVENSILAGSSITQKVIDALEDFDIFMPIITRSSVNSVWVNQEIGFAVARTNSYSSKGGIIIPGQGSGSVVPIIQDGLSSKMRGFLVNIEGIKYDPRNPDNSIIKILYQLSTLPIFQSYYGLNNQFGQRCPSCKEIVSITRPSVEELIETIEREERLHMLCPNCNLLLIFNPKTLHLSETKRLNDEELREFINY